MCMQDEALRPFVAVLRHADSAVVREMTVQVIAQAISTHPQGLGSGAMTCSLTMSFWGSSYLLSMYQWISALSSLVLPWTSGSSADSYESMHTVIIGLLGCCISNALVSLDPTLQSR